MELGSQEKLISCLLFAFDSPKTNSHCSLPRDRSGTTSRSSIMIKFHMKYSTARKLESWSRMCATFNN